MFLPRTYIFMLVFFCVIVQVYTTPSHRMPEYEVNICNDDKEIVAIIYPALSTGYKIEIRKRMTATTQIQVKLDSGGTIIFGFLAVYPLNDTARFTTANDYINNIFNFILLKDTTTFKFVIKGRYSPEHPPYITSLKINGEENCKEPNRTFFGDYEAYVYTTAFWAGAPDKFCGRRRVNRQYTELIVSGSASQSGDWPWHSAIYRLRKSTVKYICGGTLISKYSILTAAHCATIGGVPVNPDIIGVILGKYRLIGDEVTTQNKGVHEVIVHDDFERRLLNNDIAILKLTTEAIFNNYVQPACLWLDDAYDQMESYELIGTVVGWGIDQSENLSNKLRIASMPLVPDITCIRYDAVFYNNMLNGKKFCAGYNNGTSACNGDSGGGFMVFVLDSKTPSNFYYNNIKPGAWYVKGIVSASLAREGDSVCDPRAFTVFTDVAKYRNWILSKM